MSTEDFINGSSKGWDYVKAMDDFIFVVYEWVGDGVGEGERGRDHPHR